MHINPYLRTLWMIARPRTLLLISLQGILGYVFLTNKIPNVLDSVFAILCIIFAYMHAVAVNDISDEEVDKLNKKFLEQDNDRPLLDKTLTTKQLWVLLYCIGVAWIAVSVFISWAALFATIILIALNFIYSLPPIRLSSRGLLAQLSLPIMYVVYPLFLAVELAGRINVNYLLLVICLYIAFVGRLFLKDIRDEKGDAEAGKLTFVVRHGVKLTLLWATICICAGIIGLGCIIFSRTNSIIPLLAAIAASAGVIFVGKVCYSQELLSRKLLDVAIIGRLVSAIVFISLLTVGLSYEPIEMWQVVLLQVFAIIIFAFGVVTLQEEKNTQLKYDK